MQKNAELSKQVAEIKPAWTDYMDNFRNKFRLGTLIYADWRMYRILPTSPRNLPRLTTPVSVTTGSTVSISHAPI